MVLLLPSYTAEIKKGRAHRDFVNSLLLSSRFRLPTHKASETRPPQTSPPRQEMRWWCPRTLPHFRFRCQMMRRQPRSGSPEPRLRAMLTHSALRCAPRARSGRAPRAFGRGIRPHRPMLRCAGNFLEGRNSSARRGFANLGFIRSNNRSGRPTPSGHFPPAGPQLR